MKINLLLNNPGDLRSGYLNIDPFATGDDARVKGGLELTKDGFVEANEAEEVIALDILDYCTEPNTLLQGWLSRLAHGGRLTISVVDFREVSRMFLAGGLSMDDVNDLLFGKTDSPYQKKIVFTLSQLVEVFTNLGYKVISKRVTQDHRAIVTVERP